MLMVLFWILFCPYKMDLANSSFRFNSMRIIKSSKIQNLPLTSQFHWQRNFPIFTIHGDDRAVSKRRNETFEFNFLHGERNKRDDIFVKPGEINFSNKFQKKNNWKSVKNESIKTEKKSKQKTTIFGSIFPLNSSLPQNSLNIINVSSNVNISEGNDKSIKFQSAKDRDNSSSPTQMSPIEILHHLYKSVLQDNQRINNHKKLSSKYSIQFNHSQTEVDKLLKFYHNISLILLESPESNISEETRKFLKNFTSNDFLSRMRSKIDEEVPKLEESNSSYIDTEGIVRILCYSVIFVCGVVGNSMVIVTLVQNRKMRTITNVFILNLAISDLLLGMFCMPFTLVGSLLRDFVFGSLMCKLVPYIQAISVFVSVWTLVAISLERHYAICHPLQSRGWQTLSHAYKVITLVWIMSVILMIPIAALSQLVPIGSVGRHKCREVWPLLSLERSFSLFLAAILLVVPLVIMVTTYTSISLSLWHGMHIEKKTEQVISMTDIKSLAIVQQSLRSHNSVPRKTPSKIAIRFRKIPPQKPLCSSCHHDESSSINNMGSPTHENVTNNLTTAVINESQCGPITHNKNYLNQCRNSDKMIHSQNTLSIDENDCKEYDNDYRGSKKIHGTRKLRSTHHEKSIAAKKHVIKMLFVVVLEFFICWTPIFIVNILYLFLPEQVYTFLGPNGVSFFHLLSYASSCCNPITYCFMNRKFLQGFKNALNCCKKKVKNQNNLKMCDLSLRRRVETINSSPHLQTHFETPV